MKLTVPVYTAHAMAKQTALLDSGATENFISHRTWEKLGIGKKALEHPIIVYNVDGTRNKKGEVTHYCWLQVKHGGQEKLQQFFLMSLGGDRMILGYPFLREFDPPLNWAKGELKNGPVTLQSARYKYLKSAFRRAGKALAHTGAMPDKLVVFLRHTNLAQEWSRIEEKKRTTLAWKLYPWSSDVTGRSSQKNCPSDSHQLGTLTWPSSSCQMHLHRSNVDPTHAPERNRR